MNKPVRLPLTVFLLLLLCVTAACRRQESPPPSPEEIMSSAAARLAESAGFHFILDHTGEPATLDPDGLLSFRRAEGDFAAPDRARATVRIAAPGLVTDVDVISVAERQWQTNFLTKKWEELPPNWGFNPAVLFDNQVGLQAILASDLSDLSLTGIEQLEDRPDAELYAITGQAMGERLHQMSGGLIGPEPVDVQLWVAPETFELVRVIVTEPATGSDEPSVWQVDFSNFDQTLSITPPESK